MNISILIPCYNEELTIEKVIKDFRKELPEADIYVYDNNSTDNTYKIALARGAIVKKEPKQGKGNVVRSMFRDIDADIYVMVDGDDTYPAEAVHALIKPLLDNECDMVTGDRISNGSYDNLTDKRPFHSIGNTLVAKLVNRFFNSSLNDVMTGYRAFNKRFVKHSPVLCSAFELETELTLHALDKGFRIQEIPIRYRERPSGSESKLHTFRDGFLVLKTFFRVIKDYKPLMFFFSFSMLLLLAGLLTGIPVINEFIRTGFISKIPSAILAVGFVLCAGLSLTCGLILDTVVRQHKENFEVMLLQETGDNR
jgi:glycosyltransferase involved in cell wall biosynthesis